MSLKKSAARRLSLLAGSSLVAASLATVAFTATALTPTSVMAADECTPVPPTLGNGPGPVSDDPTLNGPAPDSFACSATTYANGITYNSAGDLTVSKTNTTNTTITANGINLTATGTDSVTWNSGIAGSLTAGAGTGGPLIDVTSVSGAINLTTSNVTANAAGTTHGIRATSTGGGNITLTRIAGGAVNNNSAASQAAIELVTNGGNISYATGAGGSAGGVAGGLRGILAQTSGAGSVSINTIGAIDVSASAVDGVAIDVTAGTGGVTLIFGSSSVRATAAGAKAIRVSSLSSANVQNGGTVSGAVDFSGVTVGGVTFSNVGTSATSGRWFAQGASVFSGLNDSLTIGGSSTSELRENASIDFGAGNDTMTIAATFDGGGGTTLAATLKTAAGTMINFGAGADVLNVSGFLNTNGTVLDFGADNDTFNLSGRLSMNGLTLAGLENFNNSGLIMMGVGRVQLGAGAPITDEPSITDGAGDDILRMDEGTFTGSGDSRVVMDVFLGGGSQASCAAPTGVADCLDFRGASTAGVTALTINNIASANQLGGFNPVGITLVDGGSAEEHFVLDPGSAGYVDDPLLGEAISVPGLFRYTLQYDPETQRHLLVSLPGREALEYAVLSGAAQSIWHMTTEAVTDRQTDLRDGTEASSVWLRSAGEYTKRDIHTDLTSFGQTFSSDNSYKLYAGVLMVGSDLLTGTTGGFDHVIGFQAGYVSSSMELAGSDSSARFTGGMGGVYGSLWNSWFFLNGTANINGVTLDYESPALGSKTTTFVNSIGAAAEAGTHTALTENTFIEPLVAASWVRTSFEEISLRGGEVQPDDAESARVALGLRLGGTLPGQNVSATYFVTGRGWYEFEGESAGLLHNPGMDMPFTDELSGAFGEAEAGISVYNAANTLSGFLTSGVKWKDGYSAVNLSLGVRMAW